MFQNRAYGETAPFPTARQSAAAYESERDLLPLESVFGWEQYGMIKPSRKTLLVCEIITRKVYLLTLWDGGGSDLCQPRKKK